MEHTTVPVKIKDFDVIQTDILQVSCGNQHSLFLTQTGEVIACGHN